MKDVPAYLKHCQKQFLFYCLGTMHIVTLYNNTCIRKMFHLKMSLQDMQDLWSQVYLTLLYIGLHGIELN